MSLLMCRCIEDNVPFFLSCHFNHVSHDYFIKGIVYDLEVSMPDRKIFRHCITYQGTITRIGSMML